MTRRQNPPQTPRVDEEIVVFFKKRRRDFRIRSQVRSFKRAAYSLQVAGSHPLLVITEGTGEHRQYIFNWTDVDHVMILPSSLSVVEPS